VAVLFVIALAVVTYGLILIPVAIGVVALVWYRRTRPVWKAQRLINQATRVGEPEAVAVLYQALEIDPDGKKTLKACGDWFYDHACWLDAGEVYAGYLDAVADLDTESRYVRSLVNAGRLDDALPRLEHLRQLPFLEDESRATVISMLAAVYVMKGDVSQASALIGTASLQKHQLGLGLQQCLYMRAVCRYLLGQRRTAIPDLDRLYAVSPAYPRVGETKSEMLAGAYCFEQCSPRPDWYPVAALSQGVSESATEGVSADDGLLNALPESHVESGDTPSEWISPDGLWRWDGAQWLSTIDGSPAPPSMA
jgi:tetratricopeptide (TPR) repeat protein